MLAKNLTINVFSNEKVVENYSIKLVVELLFKSVSTAVDWSETNTKKECKDLSKS